MQRREYLAAIGVTATAGCLRLEGSSSTATRTRSPTSADPGTTLVSTQGQSGSGTATDAPTAASRDTTETTRSADPTTPEATNTTDRPRSITDDWPEFRADPANTRYHPDVTGPTDTAEVLWTFRRQADLPTWRSQEPEWPVFNPVVAGGHVYVASQDDHIYALDAATGAEQWRFSHDVSNRDLGRKCTPVVADGTVYAEGSGGHLYALDASGGSLRWFVRAEIEAIPATPTVVDGTLFVSDNRVLALDVGNGGVQWEWKRGDPGLAVDGGVVYTTDNQEVVFEALDAATGEQLWTADVHTQTPTVAGDVVLGASRGEEVTGQDHKVYALETSDGTIRWQRDLPASHSPSVAGDTSYLGSEGSIYALNLSDGSTRWRYRPVQRAGIVGAPAIAGEHLYYGDGNGWLHCLTTGGDKRWQVQVADAGLTTPAVASGVVFVCDRSGGVHAVAST